MSAWLDRVEAINAWRRAQTEVEGRCLGCWRRLTDPPMLEGLALRLIRCRSCRRVLGVVRTIEQAATLRRARDDLERHVLFGDMADRPSKIAVGLVPTRTDRG